jgi:CSLREA domain-containing protein
MSRLPRRYNYVRPLLVVMFLFIIMALPGGQRSVWNAVRPTARAAVTFTVNSVGDAEDINPGDGICSDGGACTLRAAIQEVSAASGADTINFNLPANSIITLNTQLPYLSGNISIVGPGSTLLTIQRSAAAGTPIFQIFSFTPINGNFNDSVSGLTLLNGNATGTFTSNMSGGGIFNFEACVLTLTDVVISGSTSTNGGGLYNEGTATLTNCKVTGNSSPNGGGILNRGTMTIINSTVSGNTSDGQGAGIVNNLSSFNASGSLTLTNSTVSGNSAINGGVGAIANLAGSSNVLNLSNTTVTANTASGSGSGVGGIFNGTGSTANIKNSIIAQNTSALMLHDLNGTFNSQGYNLIGESNGGTGFTNGTNGDQVGTTASPLDPKLGVLADNGGLTKTHALLVGSPAIDAGNSVLTTDQRGQPRPVDDQTVVNAAGGNGSDIGSYEAHLLEVNTTADTDDGLCRALGTGNGCTLREAINAANTEAGAELITFAPSLTSGGAATITLLSALPDLSSSMTINGPGVTLLTVKRSTAAGTVAFRIFTMNSGTIVSMSGFTVTNGRTADGAPGSFGGAAGDGGGILNNGNTSLDSVNVATNRTGDGGDGGAFGGAAGKGAGIANFGTMSITNCNVVGNSGGVGGDASTRPGDGGFGGGVSNAGIFTATNSSISGNSGGGGGSGGSFGGQGGNGGGIFTDGGTTTLTNSHVDNNTAGDNGETGNGGFGGHGGGISIMSPAATVILTNSTVSGNFSGGSLLGTKGFGGGVMDQGVLLMTGSTISSNIGKGPGGGLMVQGSGAARLSNSTVSDNFSQAGGGGIYNDSSTSLSLTNCTISNNRADSGQGVLTNASTRIRNTVIAGNGLVAGGTSDVIGPFNSQGHNLIGKSDGSSGFTNGVNSDQVGTIASPVNALLGPLANNGGPTSTHPLLPGSPAIDAGDNCVTLSTHCGDANLPVLTTDQRGTGFSRLVNTSVDIGAFESRGFSIAATSGSGQSREIYLTFSSPLVATVSSAFGEPVAGGLVLFSAPLTGASGTFSGGSTTATITIDGLGRATTPDFTANPVPGSYSVSSSIYGSSTSTSFSLTNTKGSTATVLTSSVNPSDFGESVTFTATVTSAGGTPTGTVQFREGPDLFGTPVTCVAGAGHTCTAQISTSSLGVGTHNISAEYSGDANFVNSLAFNFSQTIKPVPSLSINDVSIAEGDSGTKTASFTVTLSASSHLEVKVDYATANNSAVSGSDYQTTSGTLTFAPGDTTKTISVTINGDLNFETDETYFVNLSAPVNATIADSQGQGTIQNDDPVGGYLKFPSANFVNDENSGQTVVSVNRIGDTSQAVTVDYATSDNGPLVPCSTINSFASSRCDYTTALGTLRFAAGETSKTFLVLISQDNYVEGSESLTITLSNPTGGAQFATPSTATLTITDDPFEPLGNPVDNADVFVRQHYHDFLNREPDAPGLAFWSNQITECFNPALNCSVDERRVNVSAAFFLSIEFQETGYLVERIYKSAYGDADGTSVIGGTAHTIKVPIVRFNEFLRDSQQISKGVLVGVGNWQAILEANKIAFTQDFVTRSRFVNAYPTTLTPAQFVDALFVKISIVPDAAERTSIINEFGGAGTTADTAARARALRRVAENEALKQAEKNKAFVLMQYFGYLRRNPVDPQDTDHTGYDFWLQKLNEHNGNYINAEMVKAFIVSGEYRNRFGN